jgi:hypothetical protein
MDEVPSYTTEESLQEVVRAYLETSPLLRAVRFKYINGHRLWPPALTYHCAACRLARTFKKVEVGKKLEGNVVVEYIGRNHDRFVIYLCAYCERNTVSFWCSVETTDKVTSMRKVGQSPAWSIAVPSAVEAALPPGSLAFYKKGAISLSQSFGLGAVAYFRRAVEEVTGHLLDLVEQAASIDPAKPDTAALAAIAVARKSHRAEDKLRIAADVVPGHLKPNGENPLAKLYDAYSEGVHSLSDEESVETAITMRVVLDYVMPQLTEQLRAAREFQAAMKKPARKLKPPTASAKGDTTTAAKTDTTTAAKTDTTTAAKTDTTASAKADTTAAAKADTTAPANAPAKADVEPS